MDNFLTLLQPSRFSPRICLQGELFMMELPEWATLGDPPLVHQYQVVCFVDAVHFIANDEDGFLPR